MNAHLIELLRCPVDGSPLRQDGDDRLVSTTGRTYCVNPKGIPLLAEYVRSSNARQQEAHYDTIAKAYLDNLGYPHTQVYMSYLDDAFYEAIASAELGCIAEICCGAGEALKLLAERMGFGIGVDISVSMLEAATANLDPDKTAFVQGDATRLPLRDACFDSVFMMGGIHHVNDRPGLFAEIYRILKPGGRFYYREPVSDLWLWRWLRAIIYRLSPTLDAETERPLLHAETVPVLEGAGFETGQWKTYGVLGYCVMMNSDVLVLNRLFRFVPGIRAMSRWMTRLDDLSVRLPGMGRAGLIVIGSAIKPHEA